MNVTIFGAAGWVGRALLKRLSGRHRVRAVDRNADVWRNWEDIDGRWDEGEIVHADIEDGEAVDKAIEGADAVVHLAVYYPRAGGAAEVGRSFGVNVVGLWNVLEASRRRGVRRIVHVGSCQVAHSQGRFFTADVRRPDGTLYAVCKRLQEEMCRQFHEAHRQSIIVLRPSAIVDGRLAIDMARRPLGPPAGPRTQSGWVCRHDLAEACRLALDSPSLDFDILHIVGTPESDLTCDAARARTVLGLRYESDLDRFR